MTQPVHLPGQRSWILGIRRFGVAIVLVLAPLGAQAALIPEYQAKAGFLLNIAQFVSWPSPSPEAPLVIGLLGDDPFGSYLDEAVRGQKVNNRLLTVQRFRRRIDSRPCTILFISQSERDRVDQILSSLKGRAVLTVSDIDGFTDLGGMIQLFTEKNNIRMRINLDAVKASNLRVSSKLLRVAEVAH
jgi:hypothetical protein